MRILESDQAAQNLLPHGINGEVDFPPEHDATHLSVVLFWQPEQDGPVQDGAVQDGAAQALEEGHGGKDTEASEAGGENAFMHFAQLPWPDNTRLMALDVSRATRTAEWFGIRDTPALAVVHNGMLLAVEHHCQPDACGRLLECARKQQQLLREQE